MATLVTGAAGFIGFHTAKALLAAGEAVIGIDNLNTYYDPALKRARLSALRNQKGAGGFAFHEIDISDRKALTKALKAQSISHIIHLAAQAGVRYSLENPNAYGDSNLVGHLNMLEVARHTDTLESMVYASSSSVYGGNTKLPFAEGDSVDAPVSLYAATKRANELMSQAYSHLYGLPLTGLRFFTVYGPWGRPDMAPWLFTDALFAGRSIKVFNNGQMARDFTYIDDIVSAILAASKAGSASAGDAPRHRLYNIGNHRPTPLLDFIATLERLTGRTAEKIMLPMQPGDVKETYADLDRIRADLGFEPRTGLEAGLEAFVSWFRWYHKI